MPSEATVAIVERPLVTQVALGTIGELPPEATWLKVGATRHLGLVASSSVTPSAAVLV
jgi:hypothetical protein